MSNILSREASTVPSQVPDSVVLVTPEFFAENLPAFKKAFTGYREGDITLELSHESYSHWLTTMGEL